MPAHIRSRQRVAEPRGDHRPRLLGRADRHPRRRDLRRMQRLRRRSQSRSPRHLTVRTRRRHARRARRRHRDPRRPTRNAATGRHPPGPDPRRVRRSRRLRRAPGSRHQPPRQPSRPPPPRRRRRQPPRLLRRQHRPTAVGHRLGVPGVIRRARAEINRINPYAAHRSYTDLANTGSARDLGRIMGANPIPIIAPCHRVTRGVEVPTAFVGGTTAATGSKITRPVPRKRCHISSARSRQTPNSRTSFSTWPRRVSTHP